jgi:4'-phosphopantetheinyl transferase EntD
MMPDTEAGVATEGPSRTTVDEADLTDGLTTVTVPGVRVGWRRIDAADVASLHDIERARTEHAVAVRRHEFASGRALLRELIGRPVAIPSQPNRAAALPPGLRGSLAHDREVAVAAVSDDPRVLALGIDVEPATPLTADVARVVLRPDEAGLDAHQAFTLKEAAYKAWSTLGGRMLDHHDVRLTVRDGTFTAEVIDDGSAFTGRWAHAGGRWLALVVVRDSRWRST